MNKLNKKQERLISAYYDCELGVFSNFYVQKILLRKPQATSFLNSLSKVSNQFQEESISSDFDPKWNLLNLRLLQVEKNTIFHQEELPQSRLSTAGVWKKFSLPTTLATASVAFCLGLLFKFGYINYFTNNASPVAAQNIATNLTSGQKATTGLSSNIPVTLASSKTGSNSGSNFQRSALELDWVKSDGRIRMIPARNGSSNIIWVKAPRKIYLEKVQSGTPSR
jgi:hypothetical protein